MRKKLTKIISVLVCLTMVLSFNAALVYATTDFEGYTPITDATELKAIESDLAGNYYLANDIVMPDSWESIGWLEEDTAFTGIFDGNGKTVSGLKMNYGTDSTYVGLFAINGGTIKNLIIDSANVKGGSGVGAVAGVNKGIITDCTVKNSDVIGVAKNYSTTLRIGGVTGQNGTAGTVTNCIVSDVYVTGNRLVGGVAGSNLGAVSNCTVTNIKINSRKNIEDIYKNGAANYVNYSAYVWSYVGGLVGNNQGSVTESCVLGDIALYGFEFVGGLIGYNSGNVSKLWMGATKTDIPYYTQYNYGNYTFYAEAVKLTVGINEDGAGVSTDVYSQKTHSAHSFGEDTILVPVTCTADGLKSHKCTQCSFVEEVVIEAVHKAGEWTEVTAATCSATGLKELRCADCNTLIDTAIINKLAHSAGDSKIVKPATCVEVGAKETRCTVCNELIADEEITALPHTKGEWTVVTSATCTSKGLSELRCTVCNLLLDEAETETLAHTAGEWTTAIAPTCTAAGLRELRCTECSALIDSKEIDALGHTEGEWTVTVAPTCTEKGTKTISCTVCQTVLKTEKVNALGHDNGVWTNAVQATCTFEGSNELRCSACNGLLDSETVPAIGHADADYDGECDNCGTKMKRNVLQLIQYFFSLIKRKFLSMFPALG